MPFAIRYGFFTAKHRRPGGLGIRSGKDRDGREKHLASIRTRARSAASTLNRPPSKSKRAKLGNQAAHAHDTDAYDEVFKKLDQETKEADSKAEYTAAKKAENRPKNRYGNILPSDGTRVKLCPTPDGEHDDDYINANHVESHGPLPSTVDDFWKMVWQENVQIIVMLTPLIEKDTAKCARYYPHNREKIATFGNISLTLVSKEKAAYEIKIRKLLLENSKQDGPPRMLLHVQYSAWPDFGLPTAGTQGFRECIRLVKTLGSDLEKERASTDTSRAGPIVVHCSAGVGRSGTFCTVHSILHRLEPLAASGKPVPDVGELINQTVRAIRSQRAGMVQTKDQYSFCHKAIVDAIHATTEGSKM